MQECRSTSSGLDLYMPRYLPVMIQKAVVGSINLDFRSLYHHFECRSLHDIRIR